MKSRRIIKWGIPIVILFCISFAYLYYSIYRESVFDIYFFDLDRGRSVFIYTPNNKSILIDGGANNQILRELNKILPFYKRNIDTIILTNSFPKNIGGLIDIVKRYKIGEIIKSEIMGTSSVLEIFENEVEKRNIIIKTVKMGDSFNIDNVQFSVLFPDFNFKYNKTSKPELVLNISHASTSILLLGDISKTIQKSLIDKIDKVNIIEYAHGASESRVFWPLFDKANPDYVIISKQKNSAPFIKRNNAEIINLKDNESKHFRF